MSDDANEKNKDNQVAVVDFCDYEKSVSDALDAIKFEEKLKNISRIIIKPNLLEVVPPPCTTDVNCTEALIKYILKKNNKTEVLIIEGSGGCNTQEALKSLGYVAMAKKYDIKIIDVDNCQLVKLTNANALAYKEIYLPEAVFGCWFISVPCLKDHSITAVTLGLKNLIGLLPKKYYGGYWSYNRSDVHRVGVNRAIVDLNNYRSE
ncbi:MAG: DUF362 domain-containing protein, partial [Actinobacteria bacterium]|nr:DUF362 domain-containing protein [Actinomycetota bacterium]